MTQPEALRLAAELEACPSINYKTHAAKLRRLSAVEAQRDALLEALKGMRHKYGEYACSVCDHADAAIKAVEDGK